MCDRAKALWLTVGQCDDFASLTNSEVSSNTESVRYAPMKANTFRERMPCCSDDVVQNKGARCCRLSSYFDVCPLYTQTRSDVTDVCHLTEVGRAVLVPPPPPLPQPPEKQPSKGDPIRFVVSLAGGVLVILCFVGLFLRDRALERKHSLSILSAVRALRQVDDK